jgi:hypothetical protein
MKNSTRAIPIAPTEILVKPNNAAINAIMKKIRAQYSILSPLFYAMSKKNNILCTEKEEVTNEA